MIIIPEIEHDYSVPYHLFKKTDGKDYTIVEDRTDDETKEEKKRVFICSYCSHVITTPEDIAEISGSHTHVFKNPGGYIYEIGCFRYAEGCINIGEPTGEFTWFPGFNWTYAICGSCHNHMGWYFGSNESGFYGLVIDYLSENI